MKVGPDHPTCPPWCPGPWSPALIVETPREEIEWVHYIKWEAFVRVEADKRAAAEAKVPPRLVQVPTWPDANGVRGLHWTDANKTQTPELW